MSKEINLDEALELLKKAHSVALACHIGPDGDTLGSALALSEGLRQTGKRVAVMVDDSIASTYRFMPGIGDILTAPEDFGKDSYELLVVIDASSIDRIGRVADVFSIPILNIDHHVSNTKYADYLWLNANATATGEMVFALLKNLQVEITLSMAICLYVAIATDCGFFKYSNTSPESMCAAAELLKIGVEPNVVSDFLEMKSRENIVLLSQVLNTLEFSDDGKISMIEIPFGKYNKDIDTDSFIQYPRYVEGVELAIMFKAVEAQKTRVSMRSRWLDVSKIALSFDGGGHKKAAGCTIEAELPEAKKLLLRRVQEEMEALR